MDNLVKGVIRAISGPVLEVVGSDQFQMMDMVKVGSLNLIGEVINIKKGAAIVQVYESTTGLKIGEEVVSTSMPNDDITHPIPDLTGYITEGQIVMGRDLNLNGVYPPISVLPSLSRLMKDGIGEGYTRADHPDLSNQLFASYAKVMDIRALASVIGEDELSELDKKYMEFGRQFENRYVAQPKDENRSIERTLEIGWGVLSYLPREELDRIDQETLNKYYRAHGSE